MVVSNIIFCLSYKFMLHNTVTVWYLDFSFYFIIWARIPKHTRALVIITQTYIFPLTIAFLEFLNVRKLARIWNWLQCAYLLPGVLFLKCMGSQNYISCPSHYLEQRIQELFPGSSLRDLYILYLFTVIVTVQAYLIGTISCPYYCAINVPIVNWYGTKFFLLRAPVVFFCFLVLFYVV